MTESATVLLIAIPAIIGSVASVVTMLVSIVSVLKTIEVHHLVNSQFSEQVRKTAEALEKLAKASPTTQNIKAAEVASQINTDREKGL